MRKTLIIAEAGVNHNGNIQIAKKLIEVAAEAGADFVKFQTFKTENLVSKSAKLANYQAINLSVTNSEYDNSQFSLLKKLELSYQDHIVLIDHCKKNNISFFSTAFDIESIDFLNKFDFPFWKIPSGEITNLPYLEKIGGLSKDIIMSTGMSSMNEIEDALQVLLGAGVLKEQLTVLHCNTEYPTPMHDVNLLAMLEIKKKLNVKVGYSDHTLGTEVPIAAVALGAKIIEKHFTLDRNMEGPDHKASIEPDELKHMVNSIRNIELALGNSLKQPTNSEIHNISIARKSIHLKHELKRGHIINSDDLIMKRPGDGISPMKMNEIIGKSLKDNFPQEHKISFKDFL